MGRRAAVPPEEIMGLDVPVPAWLHALRLQLPPGRQQDCCDLLLQSRRLKRADFEAIFTRYGGDAGAGAISQVVLFIRDHLLGSGWHVATLGGCAYELRPGEDAERFSRKLTAQEKLQRLRDFEASRAAFEKEAKAARPVRIAAVPPPAPAPALPSVLQGPRKPSIPILPKGQCQRVSVVDGELKPCGAPADGTYCPPCKAATAGVPYREGVW